MAGSALLGVAAGLALGAGWRGPVAHAALRQGAPARPTYADPLHRFSITAPRFAAPGPGEKVIPVMFLGAEQRGASPNVNVLVEPSRMPRDQSRQVALAQ